MSSSLSSQGRVSTLTESNISRVLSLITSCSTLTQRNGSMVISTLTTLTTSICSSNIAFEIRPSKIIYSSGKENASIASSAFSTYSETAPAEVIVVSKDLVSDTRAGGYFGSGVSTMAYVPTVSLDYIGTGSHEYSTLASVSDSSTQSASFSLAVYDAGARVATVSWCLWFTGFSFLGILI